MTGLRARGVRVRYGGTPVVDGVDLDVLPGQLLALLGPNGAGKSTLLGVLAGDVRPDEGSVELNGVDVRAMRLDELARRRAVLLQEHHLSFPFEVADVVRMGRSPWRGTAREDDDDRVVAGALATADVAHLAARRFPTLSGGEKARASFARTLAQEPGVLLLDEPTAALDIRHQEALLTHAATLTRKGAAVVVVLHDLTLAAAYADRLVLLADGRVRGDGPPHEVLDPGLLTEVYRHPLEVVRRPGTDEVVVLPVRPAMHPAAAQEVR
ncbi:heme ABC transporter ATP-binding protein [Cellulomonas sp.]|uniref:heme ABC transporter ATP-binding protein n=1 Tax=Cellulomonas sp. TaxID=40001 RepID=UPI002587F966|nr:heme ABC transporter ATP-binding protein [Cellulomonas sp.]MCR6689263.1 heme ABC transporter ATP-binding protein [Cellulomonas sp.]